MIFIYYEKAKVKLKSGLKKYIGLRETLLSRARLTLQLGLIAKTHCSFLFFGLQRVVKGGPSTAVGSCWISTFLICVDLIGALRSLLQCLSIKVFIKLLGEKIPPMSRTVVDDSLYYSLVGLTHNKHFCANLYQTSTFLGMVFLGENADI